jgi:hypothetical protein
LDANECGNREPARSAERESLADQSEICVEP